MCIRDRCPCHARSSASPIWRRAHLEVHRGSLGRRDRWTTGVHGQGGRVHADARTGGVSRRLSHARGRTNMTTEDEVALLVRLAGPTSLTGPIAPLDEARLARVRTAVHGAWRDEVVARQSKTRRRWLAVTVLLAAAASVVIAFAFWGPTRTLAPIRTPAPV